MRIYKLAGLCMAALFFQVTNACSDDQNVERLMSASGLSHMVQQLPEVIVQSSSAQSSDQSINQVVTTFVRQSFSTPSMMNRVREEVTNNLRYGDIEKLLAWWESPLGQRIAQRENYINSPEGIRAFQAWQAQQKTGSMASSWYRDNLERLDRAVKGSETAILIVQDLFDAMFVSIVDQRLSNEQRLKFRDKAKEEIKQPIKFATMVNMTFAYKDFSASELMEYVRYCESTAAKRFHKAGFDGIRQEMKNFSGRLAQRMAEYVRAKQAESANLDS